MESQEIKERSERELGVSLIAMLFQYLAVIFASSSSFAKALIMESLIVIIICIFGKERIYYD